MGNAATAKKGNEQESGEQSNATDRARRVVLAFRTAWACSYGKKGGKPFLALAVYCRGRYKASSAVQAPSLVGALFCLFYLFLFICLFLTRCVRLPRNDSRLHISLENMSWMMRLACYRWRHGKHASGSGPSSPCRSISQSNLWRVKTTGWKPRQDLTLNTTSETLMDFRLVSCLICKQLISVAWSQIASANTGF